MPILTSEASATDTRFEQNDAAQRELVADLRRRLATAAAGGPERARERHVARGKLLPRDRIDALLDEGSPFLELAPLAATGMCDDESPAAGVIAGNGLVAGRHVMIVCTDAAISSARIRNRDSTSPSV